MRGIYLVMAILLLWLYYTRKEITIIAVFIVFVLATFGNKMQEGVTNKEDSETNMTSCNELGFKAPKIDKKKLEESLESEVKKIKAVADKHWKYDDVLGTTKDEGKKKDLKKLQDAMQAGGGEFSKEENDIGGTFLMSCLEIYGNITDKDESKRKTPDLDKIDFDKVSKGGDLYIKLFEKLDDSDEIKELKEDPKKIYNYYKCLCKHWVSLMKEVKTAKDAEK
jgi:hypothetical protein